MSNLLANYLSRSLHEFKKFFQHPDRFKMDMFQLKTESDLQKFVVGSDASIGGFSKAYWALTPQNTGLFYGNLDQTVPSQSKIESSGYAGIRSKILPPALFSSRTFNAEIYYYLVIRAKGDVNEWFVNLQTITYPSTILWQQKLNFKTPGEWETLYIPFNGFIRTNRGVVSKKNIKLNRDEIRTVGFSITRQNCDFSLELDWIAAMNTPTTFADVDLAAIEQENSRNESLGS